jgi:dTMP kinase
MKVAAVGRFVSLEGPDGAGKSRAAGRLAQHLRARGIAVTLTREPGGTRLGEQIRELLLDRGGAERVPEADALLFNAARSQLVQEVIRPALDRGDVVVCDRFAGSTLAYQGYGAGLDLASLRLMESLAVDGTRPDLVLLLDAPVEVGLARRGTGDPSQLTRFEDAARHDRAFHERVRNGYLALAKADPGRWRVVDGDREPARVDEELFRLVDEFLASDEPSGALARMHR